GDRVKKHVFYRRSDPEGTTYRAKGGHSTNGSGSSQYHNDKCSHRHLCPLPCCCFAREDNLLLSQVWPRAGSRSLRVGSNPRPLCSLGSFHLQLTYTTREVRPTSHSGRN